jgi:hypothetical protein
MTASFALQAEVRSRAWAGQSPGLPVFSCSLQERVVATPTSTRSDSSRA